MATQITKHFALHEFCESDVANRNGIFNYPNKDYVGEITFGNIRQVAYMLEIIRKQFGHPIRITSGYRCAELNKLVGGAKKSKHLVGLAVDINCGKMLNKKLYRIIENLKDVLPVDELINEQDYSWIHVSFNQLL